MNVVTDIYGFSGYIVALISSGNSVRRKSSTFPQKKNNLPLNFYNQCINIQTAGRFTIMRIMITDSKGESISITIGDNGNFKEFIKQMDKVDKMPRTSLELDANVTSRLSSQYNLEY